MSSTLELELKELEDTGCTQFLKQIVRGIEKESLRISKEGYLAQSLHPVSLGSALTHNSITTDYSEALLELITAPNQNIEECLKELSDIHGFIYRNIGDEILWTTSMPCIMGGEESIPIARYGSSNVAKMKTIYRRGLGFRYGKTMQAIAGIHYNFSIPEKFWEVQWEKSGKKDLLKNYVSSRYLGLIRNFHRHSWLLIYLFGASPAVCSTFLKNLENHPLEIFDAKERSYYLPFATALRMGSLGYRSLVQKKMHVSYNSLNRYIETLSKSITTSHPQYQRYASGEGAEYEQLNGSLLQIENEFYSNIRPKRVTNSGEAPSAALRRGGIEYIEVRCIDVNPFIPLGIDKRQSLFFESFLLYCLFSDSPYIKQQEQTRIDKNFDAIVNRGRDPDLQLATEDKLKPFSEMAQELLAEIELVTSIMSGITGDSEYITSFTEQKAKVEDASLTPSQRMLREMKDNDLTFFELALSYSQTWANKALEKKLSYETISRLNREASESVKSQKKLEDRDVISFEQYLKNYYAQYINYK